MAIKKQGLVMPGTTTRRQFTGLLCASGLLNLVGCGGGTGGANASATPAGAPQITLAPQSANFALGQSITLRAEASGSGLAYQWQRNGVALNGATGSSLQLAAAPADDGAQYSVRVSNSAGQVESPVATLTLKMAAEISLLAGAIGSFGELTDGEGAQARFASMGTGCLDQYGNLYVIETGAKTLRKITPSGTVSTVFTNFPSEGGVAVDADGYFYGVHDRGITKVSPSGEQRVFAGQSGLGWADGVGSSAQFARPMGLTFDAQGNLLVGDSPDVTQESFPTFVFLPTYNYGSTIRKITPAGVVSTIAGTPGQVTRVTQESFVEPDPELNFIEPKALACDANGRVWVRDRSGVRRIDAPGAAPVRTWSNTIWAGDMAYAVGSPGDVYLAYANSILKLGANGTQTVVAGATNNGVQLGALPASLGAVSFIVSASPRVLYVGSGNAVLRIQLS